MRVRGEGLLASGTSTSVCLRTRGLAAGATPPVVGRVWRGRADLQAGRQAGWKGGSLCCSGTKDRSAMSDSKAILRDENALSERDCELLLLCSERAVSDVVGVTAPHMFSACLAGHDEVEGETEILAGPTYQYAQGTESCESQLMRAVEENAPPHSASLTVYMNIETFWGVGEEEAVESILANKAVRRVVMGMPHPLPHVRGKAIELFRRAGVRVDVLHDFVKAGLCTDSDGPRSAHHALTSCYECNAAALHLAATEMPMSTLKFAMTLDGKTAASSGHASWISCEESRGLVYCMRSACDAVVVGGETVRADDPKLTTRAEEKTSTAYGSPSHVPLRVVVSASLDLPEERKLWQVHMAPTLVITRKGHGKAEKKMHLESKGVEVMEFDDLNMETVARHLYDRGYMSLLWECGGNLAAPAISSGIIHRVVAYVAPKIIGGGGSGDCPKTPVGDLGLQQMTEAIQLTDVKYDIVGKDVLISGSLEPHGIMDVADRAFARSHEVAASGEDVPMQVKFYKTWNEFGLLSNFSMSPISVDMSCAPLCQVKEATRVSWKSVEHFYQASKFMIPHHLLDSESDTALAERSAVIGAIAASKSAEEAAKQGRKHQLTHPHLLRSDFGEVKIDIMRIGLLEKFKTGSGPWRLLMSTCMEEEDCMLIEYSPRDSFWGSGQDGMGDNWLGALLMEIREKEVEKGSAPIM